ncbi:LapB repeat-containing protein [Listeria sp. FSL L7-0253]|uniref:LapB repeat-containing protein n=1 Tax=Listeria cossartiae TaxID=2838249 RepID=UPI001625495F|nr:LapB repeat-containing protein [Listeria cossartiae]MBC2186095.1 LapB repeat-containing protein [Listeria cossartiae subsp. cossartiae]
MRKLPVVVSLALCFSLVSPSLYAYADTTTADLITKEAVNDDKEFTNNQPTKDATNPQTTTDTNTQSASEDTSTPSPNPTAKKNILKNNLKSTSENGNTYADLFPDANLAKVIAKTINGNEDINVEVTDAELQSVTNLVANNQNITSLAGIERLTALETISVNYNELTSLDPLFDIPTLKSISANNNKLSGTFSLVKTMPELETLDLFYNSIKDLDVENQPKLVTLSADELELKKLSLKNLPQLNAIGRNIGSISIDWGELESVNLVNLPKIQRVDISGNYLTSDDLHLENLPGVTGMDLSSNELTELPQLTDFTKLTSINVRSNNIGKLDSNKLVNVPNLAKLYADKQTLVLPKTIAAGDFTIQNTVENLAGQITSLKTISNNGTYVNPNITWTSENLTGLSKVSYTFDEDINSPTVVGKFTGTVTQPIEVKALPVITADKSISYEPINPKDEATFLRDIHASASENGQITSDYSEVVDFNTPGNYTVTLQAKNDFNIKAIPVTVVVHISDIQKPQVTVASNEVNFEVGTELTSAALLAKSGAVVTDPYDEAIKMEVDLTEVDTTKLGTYEATITAKSKSGKSADPVKVTVKIVDTEKPVIHVVNPEITVEKDSELTAEQIIEQAGITATDNYDEDMSLQLDFSAVKTSKPGSYKVTIYTEDASGNRSETVTITVKIPEPQKGEVTVKYVDSENNEIAESNTLTGELGVAYETIAKEIPGYTLAESPTNASGIFEETGQTVQYVYMAVSISSTDPVQVENSVAPVTTKTENNSVAPSEKAPSKVVANQMPINLPKTGDSASLIFVFMGVLLIAGLTASKVRRKN